MIFDVDGTVTLNDGLGHVGNMLGQSYVHEGVCEFLCLLRARGYQPLFLTVAHYVVHCVVRCVVHYIVHYVVLQATTVGPQAATALWSQAATVLWPQARAMLGPAGIERTRRYLFEIAVDRDSGYRLPQVVSQYVVSTCLVSK